MTHPLIGIINTERALGELEKAGLANVREVRANLATITERHRKAYDLVMLITQGHEQDVKKLCAYFDRALFYLDCRHSTTDAEKLDKVRELCANNWEGLAGDILREID